MDRQQITLNAIEGFQESLDYWSNFKPKTENETIKRQMLIDALTSQIEELQEEYDSLPDYHQ